MAATRRKKPEPTLDSSFDDVAVRAARRALTEFVVSDELRSLVTQAVNEAVPAALNRFGIDTENAEEQRKDMMHLRTWREIMDMIRTQGISALVRYLLAGLAAVIMIGISALIYRSM